MDIEEAKERLKLNLTMTLYNEENAIYKQTIVNVEDVETVLSELEKKDKIIELMAKEFYKKAHISTKCYLQTSIEECLKNKNCISCIIEYFTNKVEKEGGWNENI